MTRYEISATYADGTARVLGSERDRHLADLRAFEVLGERGVVRVSVEPTDRVAMNRKGSYR